MKWLKKIFEAKETKKFTVSARDIVLSLYYSVGTSVATAVLPNLQNLSMPTVPQIKIAVGAGLVAGIQHLVRKFLTDSKGTILLGDK